MATRFVDRGPQAAAEYTGSHAGIGVDSDDDKLYFRPNSSGRVAVIDASSTQSLVGKTVNGPLPVETVAATNVITAAESGTTFFLSHATEFVSTLPAVAAGLWYEFVVANAPETASYTIVTPAGANLIFGHVVTAQDAGGSSDTDESGADTITFVDSKAVVGDRVRVVCDGTNWFASGFCKVFDAITFTAS